MSIHKFCWLGNIKGSTALYRGDVLELPDGKIRCRCGRKLSKSEAGFGYGWTVPRHHKGKADV